MKRVGSRRAGKKSVVSLAKNGFSAARAVLFDSGYTWRMGCLLLVVETFICIWVINTVSYTEIDWNAYMQEAEGFINGTVDYALLKGNTGPLVYPAGHEYIFSVLYFLTDHGRNLRFAQYLFAVLYLVTLVLVFRIYDKCRAVPPYVLIFMCCTSYRIHSIYVLRMFNDPVAMLLFYAAVLLFLNQRWKWGCVLYSLAVSVKMNVLLFAPALFVVLLVSVGICQSFLNIYCCAMVQLVLGLPFMLENLSSYMLRAFNFGRVFMHKWTVNWRFVPEKIFVSKWFHLVLLALHLSFLAWFAATRWLRRRGGVWECLKKRAIIKLSSNEILFTLFTSNFLGIVFSRTLHYQFYVWYYHTLPFLFWKTSYSAVVRLTVMGIIELCWNTYPSTVCSSLALHVCHAALLYGLVYQPKKEKV